jgi:hypothetical protein
MKYDDIDVVLFAEEDDGPILGSGSNPPASLPEFDGSDNSEDSNETSYETPEGGKFNLASLLDKLPEELRSSQVLTSLNAEDPLPDLAKQFVHAQSLIGRDNKIVKPGEESNEEEWNSFYSEMGRPDTAEGYTDPDSPEGISFEDEAMTQFRADAHEMGLSATHYTQIMEKYGDIVSSGVLAQTQMVQSEAKAGLETLREEWGENFDTNMEVADRAFKRLADPDLTEVVAGDPVLANSPAFVKLFYENGRTILEDTVQRGGSESPSFMPNSPALALERLKQFETENVEVIMSKNYRGTKDRDSILQERMRLFQMAYPDDEPDTG